MSAIRFNVLYDRAFPYGCYRTLVEYKSSAFLGISAVCGGIFCAPIIYGTRFVGKSVTKLNYSLEKVFVYINGTLLFGESLLYPIGYNSAFYINIIPKWHKLIDLTELHNVEHLIYYSVNGGMPALMEMTIVPMVHWVVVGFEMVKKHIHYFSFKLYILKK